MMEGNPFAVSNTTRALLELQLDKDYEAINRTPHKSIIIRSKKSKLVFEIPDEPITLLQHSVGVFREILLQRLKSMIVNSDNPALYFEPRYWD